MFDDFGRPLVRGVGVLRELLARSPLAHEIPKPVELNSDVAKPAFVVGRHLGALVEERVFLRDEVFDMLVQLLIVHA